jgi:succinate dehydrogenase/fumarate reductase cytochrome b subunit
VTNKKDEIDWKIAGIAIVCLTILELAAMYHGINGTIRTIIFSLIALIVGVQLPQFKLK